jgi:hypothetical protein
LGTWQPADKFNLTDVDRQEIALDTSEFTLVAGRRQRGGDGEERPHESRGSAYAVFVPVVSGPARNIVHGLKVFQRLRKKKYQRQIVNLQAEEQ